MRVPAAGGLMLSAALLACAGDLAAPPAALWSLRVEGRVLDDAGAPVAGGRVVFYPWYSSRLQPPPAIPYPWAVTGADGRFVLSAEELAGIAIDSITLYTYGPGCDPETVATVVRREDLPDGPHGEFSRDLSAGALPAPPVTAVGDVCAKGDHPFFGARDMSLALRFDSLRGDVVYGRWTVGYRHSGLGPDGKFLGVQRNGLLVLSMLPEAWPYEGCTELRLVIPVSPRGEWGQAEILQDDGCLPDRGALVFAPTGPGWFGP